MENENIIKINNEKIIDLNKINENIDNLNFNEKENIINDLFNASLKLENKSKIYRKASKITSFIVDIGILSIFIPVIPIKLAMIGAQTACLFGYIKSTEKYRYCDKKLEKIKLIYDKLLNNTLEYRKNVEEKTIFPDIFGELNLEN